jgi:UDP-N-acetylglucosamine 2-epimerase (non-hydrolysing)
MPEEHNRRMTDHISKFLFAPTEKSADILRKENVWGDIFVTGNTVIDALEALIQKVANRKTVADELGISDYALLTMHRAENVDDKITLTGLIHGLLSLKKDIIFPAHPRTVERIKRFGLSEEIRKTKRLHIIEPVGYLDFLALMKSCDYVLTDSGGIQEEVTAPSINKQVFVLRTSTERPEAVTAGYATVVGVDPNEFPNAVKMAVSKGAPGKEHPYGDGKASVRIVDSLQDFFET